ncbi:MAG: YiiD C-terminal domain-containing protein [Proteobacteria bacterium]|nr:YiiD C-terminal domain-containing protein [Pseudomonadota bacterium]
MTQHADLTRYLQAYILEHIPLARTMQLRVTHYDGMQLEMSAPLAPNINDKQCAFGGSLASLMTLASWGLIDLNLRERGIACDIYVGDSYVCYREPVYGELRASARHADPGDFPVFVETLSQRGKARIAVNCAVAGENGEAATLESGFVAMPR